MPHDMAVRRQEYQVLTSNYLGAMRDSDTKELHTDPEKVQEGVQMFYQRLADPATSAGKTGAFLPEKAPR